MIHFDQFENQIVIEGQLVLQTPVHIGSGEKGLTGKDDLVVKTIFGSPYIPGSSIKGVLRSFLERLSQSGILHFDENEPYANPCVTGETMCLDQYDSKDAREEMLNKLTSENRNMSQEQINQLFADELGKQSCPICHLFGNKLRAGKVRIHDATVQNWVGRYDQRNGNRIDRDTGLTAEGALYDFEAVPVGTSFHFSIHGENLTTTEKKWLFIALEALRQGKVTIGGKIARGLGQVTGENWRVQELTKEKFIQSLLHPEQTYQDFSSVLLELLEVK